MTKIVVKISIAAFSCHSILYFCLDISVNFCLPFASCLLHWAWLLGGLPVSKSTCLAEFILQVWVPSIEQCHSLGHWKHNYSEAAPPTLWGMRFPWDVAGLLRAVKTWIFTKVFSKGKWDPSLHSILTIVLAISILFIVCVAISLFWLLWAIKSHSELGDLLV